MHLRTLLALWTGKLAILAARGVGWGGSNLPGRLARVLDGRILAALAGAQPLGNAVVTGTNGKTTTAKMLASILAAAGHRVTHNRAGANLITGITTAYMAATAWGGRPLADLGLMEVDEATMPRAGQEIRPRAAVVTNFFRDQLDRYGELQTTLGMVRAGLGAVAPGGRVVLNADDPLCASLGAPAPDPEVAAAAEGEPVLPLYYGIEDPAVAGAPADHTADVRHCVGCGHPYAYDLRFYAHLGRYRCPRCGQARPRPQVYARQVLALDARGSHFLLATPAGEVEVRLQVPGLYNIYNALAAAAGALALGIDLAAVQAGLAATTTAFGRMERLTIRDREVFLALVKNPVGYNEVLRTVLGAGTRCTLLLILNDLHADGTDVSWIWDVDFEMLAPAQGQVNFVLCSGLRAEDLAVRLKYAGIDPARISVERDLKKALEQGLSFVRPGELLYILPTYTAMLAMRDLLARQGLVRNFWEV